MPLKKCRSTSAPPVRTGGGVESKVAASQLRILFSVVAAACFPTETNLLKPHKENSMILRQLNSGLFALDTPLMRTNSAISDRSWVAQITGTNPKYMFERKFIERQRFQSRPTEDGTQTFGPLCPDVIYEYRGIAWPQQSGYSYRRNGGKGGFFRIVDGTLAEVEKCEVLVYLRSQAAPSSQQTET